MLLSANKLISHPIETCLDVLEGEFDLKFDDGTVMKVNDKLTKFSRFCWELNKEYDYPILPEHHAQHYLDKDGNLKADIHIPILNSIFIGIYDRNHNVDREAIVKRVFEITNNIYCKLTEYMEEYISSMSIFDFIELVNQDEFKKIKGKVRPTSSSVIRLWREVQGYIKTCPLTDNPVVRAINSKTVKMDQAMQCIAARGTLTDVDGTMFPKPATWSYLEGVRDYGMSLMESRASSKAIMYAHDPIRQTEYLNRRLQLINMYLSKLVPGDCGNDNYKEHVVRDIQIDNKSGRVTMQSDLDILVGKNCKDSNGNVFYLKSTDKHLIGKTIYIRDLSKCRHHERNGICEECFGETSVNILPGTNIGQKAITAINHDITQNVLATKHSSTSTTVDSVNISPLDASFIVSDDENNGILLNKSMVERGCRLVIKGNCLNLTTDAEIDLSDLQLSKISKLTSVLIEVDDPNKGTIRRNVKLKYDGREAMLSAELIKYMLKYRWQVDTKRNFIIDMSNWDADLIAFLLPLRQFSMLDLAEEFSKFYENKGTGKNKSNVFAAVNFSPYDASWKISDILNSRLKIPLCYIEVIVYALLCVDSENGDYRLPKNGEFAKICSYSDIMNNRSASSMLAYQDLQNFFRDPLTYVKTNRSDHPFDEIIDPLHLSNLKIG